MPLTPRVAGVETHGGERALTVHFRKPRRAPTLAERILDAPARALHRVADALSDLLAALTFAPRRRPDARLAAAGARATARRAFDQSLEALDATARRAANAAGDARTRVRESASDAFDDVADELDRLGRRAARLSDAASAQMQPRRRSLLASLWRAPTPGERAAEAAQRARHGLSERLAPLAALALSGATQGRRTAKRAATRVADVALDREPPGLLAGLFPGWFPRKSRRVERAKHAAAQTQAATAATLDAMERTFGELRRSALRIGDGEAARAARRSLDKVKRLRLAVIEEPHPQGVLDRIAQALGAAEPPPAATVRGSLKLWPFTAERGAGGLALRADPTASLRQSFGFAAAALAGAATYATVRAVFSDGRGARLDEPEKTGPFGAALRAAEPGRGRAAASPGAIPLKGWKDILLRTWDEIGADRLLAISAGVVFFALLALFPAVTALVSSYGLFASPATIGEHLGFLQSALPPGAYAIVQDQIQRVVSTADTKLGFGFVVGLALAIWSANAGMKAVIDALNIVYDETEKRGFVRLNLVSLAFTVGALAAILVGVAAIVVTPILVNALSFGRGEQLAWIATYARWPILLAMIMLGLALLYRYGPSRERPKWRWISVGSLAATALWIVGSAALSYYIANFGDYDKTYGSLGAAIGMMMWMWLSAIVVLFGAELNSEIEHQTAIDSTVGAPKPIGLRGARMADTIGEAKA